MTPNFNSLVPCAEPNYMELRTRNIWRLNKFYFNLELLSLCFSLTWPSIETLERL